MTRRLGFSQAVPGGGILFPSNNGEITGVIMSWQFAEETADEDPGSGKFRLNHADPSQASFAYVSDLDGNDNDLSGWLDSLAGGTLAIKSAMTPQRAHVYRVGTVTDATPYRKLALTYTGGAGNVAYVDDEVAGLMGSVSGPQGDPGDFQADGSVPMTSDLDLDGNGIVGAASINGGPLGGFRNKIINGDGRINQIEAASGVSDDEYGWDQHIILTQSNDIDISTLTAPADGVSSMMRLTQANASAQRMGVAHILDADTTYGLRGKTVTLGGKLRYSDAEAVRFALLEWTGTANAPTTDVVNDWTSGTYTAGNFFISSNLSVAAVGSITPSAATMTDWAMTADIGSPAKNLIAMLWTEATAEQNDTLDLRWGLVEGDAREEVDFFEPRPEAIEYWMCAQFLRVKGGVGNFHYFAPGQCVSTTSTRMLIPCPGRFINTPSISLSANSDFAVAEAGNGGAEVTSITSIGLQNEIFALRADVASGLVAGDATSLRANSTSSARMIIDARF